LCTALLRQLGAPRIVARANSKLHGRILKLVGAHEIVNPLEDFGERFAAKFVYSRLKGELPLGDDLVVAEVEARDDFVGKTLAELRMPAKLGVTVVATRSEGVAGVKLPTAEQTVQAKDILVVVARRDALEKLAGE
jgi:trk system potassium uptake protein TrkA